MVFCIVLNILFDIVGWLIFKKQIVNKTIIIPVIMSGWTLYIFRYKILPKIPQYCCPHP
ncbi:hypothetical protein COL60_27330 [Bacillus pseudomycoides]|nr:hypothetical protein COL60_27330 [Bacillus pseudomycoides]